MPCTAPSRDNLKVQGPCAKPTYNANLCLFHWEMANGLIPSPANDPLTSLLLHCNGADGAVTFPDSSPYAKVATVGGNAQIDTDQSKFGGSSVLFDGTGDYLSYPDSPDWALGAGDFTIDLWVRFASTAGNQYIIGQGDVSYELMLVGSQVRFFSSSNNSSWDLGGPVCGNPVINTWHHAAVCRQGTAIYTFLDGALGQTPAAVGALAIFDSPNPMRIGADQNGVTGFNGWVDEVRFTKGVARWTSNFSVPTAPYT